MSRRDDRDRGRDDRDRYGSNSRLYVGHLSSRTRSRDLEHIFSKYGRVRDVDLKRDYAFVEYSSPRDADDAKYHLDGRDVDGRRITVEFAKGVPRGPGGVRESAGRGPTPGSGRCFNCGLDGHWARDCTAGDWKNKCYRCGDRGHIERNCQNSPKKPKRERSYSRSPMRSLSPRRGRSRSRSFSKSRSYSRSRSPHKRGRDVVYERRLMSPIGVSPEPKRRVSPSKSKKHSSTPVRESPRERGNHSPKNGDETGQDGYNNSPQESPSPRRGRREREEEDGYSDSPKETSGSPLSPATTRYEAVNGNNRSPSPIVRDDGIPVNDNDDDDDDDARRTPRGSRSP